MCHLTDAAEIRPQCSSTPPTSPPIPPRGPRESQLMPNEMALPVLRRSQSARADLLSGGRPLNLLPDRACNVRSPCLNRCGAIAEELSTSHATVSSLTDTNDRGKENTLAIDFLTDTSERGKANEASANNLTGTNEQGWGNGTADDIPSMDTSERGMINKVAADDFLTDTSELGKGNEADSSISYLAPVSYVWMDEERPTSYAESSAESGEYSYAYFHDIAGFRPSRIPQYLEIVPHQPEQTGKETYLETQV